MQRLRQHLSSTGISQAALAKLVEVSQPTVSDWITGKSKPTALRLLKLSEVTGISIDELLRDEVAA